ncbi:mRNA decay activator protein ZFP36L1-like [Dreissena polymorpha]|uniref:C3H1-type domain-containing protein n=1 Tax=Dreissena polymorpha TaxID=45954 RepID=A0A9D4C5Q6_DREPO|nr:mRNA decay activator protein ZFP36L1-like [Dreissena polymorpha]XP_052251240.1 mRNA decay activator protein ZFP36L1-like [Dreissena polymorpha]KAH3711641.1 hypothetical protein DPMN_071312 [Dreissena polymorpha]KAH3717509.1 hypothetical protein DPMN_060299 [Dreissena polymorpha]
MSSAFVPTQFLGDIGDFVLRQNMLRQQQQQCAERRNTLGAAINVQRNRNFSVGNFTPVPANATVIMDNQTGLSEHKKLDRSYSEPCERLLNNNTNLNTQQKQPVNSSRYKTELCRPFEENGHCKYADKCQFAHGAHELKSLQRHPKYKTELCRTFHSKGFCPYGPRCNFVHNDESVSKANEQNNRITAAHNVQQSHLATQQYFQHISPPSLSQSPPPTVQRPTSINFNSSFTGSLGSSAESSPPSSVGSESPSLSPVFFGEDLLNSGLGLPLNNSLNFDNSTNSNVFSSSLMPEFGFDLSPLNIQTVSSVDSLAQHFGALLNLNNQTNKSVWNDREWSASFFSNAPTSPPDSISGESVGSFSSFGTSNSSSMSTCGSPMEVGKNFRLPVFSHISQ